MYHIDFVYN